MARKLISSGSSFEELAGYSRAVVDGDWVFVSGCTGFDYAAGTIADTVEEQAEQALRNVEAALRQAGAKLADIVRIRVYLSEREHFAVVAPIFGRAFKEIRPANTTVICGMLEDRMKVEIEATARLPGPQEGSA